MNSNISCDIIDIEGFNNIRVDAVVAITAGLYGFHNKIDPVIPIRK